MSEIINCLLYEQELLNSLSKKLHVLVDSYHVVPTLATILIGDDPASEIYVKNKTSKAKKVGIKVQNYYLPKNTTLTECLTLVNRLNQDSNINGILLQLPLPKHLDANQILSYINPAKDVDGLTLINAGLLQNNHQEGLIPCTPLGILYILQQQTKKLNTNLAGKHAVIIGRSKLVGLPCALLLNNNNLTVTLCHSYTANLSKICKQADILIVAIGKPNFVTKEFIKSKSIVIDVGINRINQPNPITQKPYTITGDVNTQDALAQAAWVTPVPQGVGRLTVVFLLYNTYKATLTQYNLPISSKDIL